MVSLATAKARAPARIVKRLVVSRRIRPIVIAKAAEAPASGRVRRGLNDSEADDGQVDGFITDRSRERIPPCSPRQPNAPSRALGDADESKCGYGATGESRDNDGCA